ncbi:RHS repeat-associated core domain-containing protein [Vibrio rhizosphaerae]|uniref:RHS repeat-associated core domain-containing protein n=1 Tax=Vibrio rhizosphaerae TaxID=398736 RepID=UPI000B26138A|nr:RHS repeat-associated core domain-containing protein [Vibrio rhizosphaerae]
MQQSQITADGTALTSTEYLYEPGSHRPMAQVTTRHGSNRRDLHYIVTDHAGTPQELVTETGDIEWRGEQALWGKYQQQQFNLKIQRGYLEDAANEALSCDLRYQGQIEDRESGLYYNLNRYYDADSGQYLSPDPIGFAGGLRPQGYVHNPMEWVDPLGLDLKTVDFTGSNDLFPTSGNQKNIVKIRMQGARGRDFTQAYKAAGINSSDAKGYTWHHVADFDPNTGETTMQLVKTEAHVDSLPHRGSVSQFEKHFGVEYGSQEAVKTSQSKGWLDGKPPKGC